MVDKRPCKDCEPGSKRPAPHPGPRCATHWRIEQKRRKAANHDRRVQVLYGLEAGAYTRLKAAQGGVCAICCRANGAAKRLAVDHDHSNGEVRGILCGPCNQLLGHGRDSIAFFQRVIDYLTNPPARKLNQ